jgi:hypothetical protein
LYSFPTTKYDRAIAIWGKSHLVGIWQDSSRSEASFFLGHNYDIEADSISFKIKYWLSDPNFIGKSFKAKYEIKGDQLIIEGFMAGAKEQHEKFREVWKRID